jgi:hypothetical protein
MHQHTVRMVHATRRCKRDARVSPIHHDTGHVPRAGVASSACVTHVQRTVLTLLATCDRHQMLGAGREIDTSSPAAARARRARTKGFRERKLTVPRAPGIQRRALLRPKPLSQVNAEQELELHRREHEAAFTRRFAQRKARFAARLWRVCCAGCLWRTQDALCTFFCICLPGTRTTGMWDAVRLPGCSACSACAWCTAYQASMSASALACVPDIPISAEHCTAMAPPHSRDPPLHHAQDASKGCRKSHTGDAAGCSCLWLAAAWQRVWSWSWSWRRWPGHSGKSRRTSESSRECSVARMLRTALCRADRTNVSNVEAALTGVCCCSCIHSMLQSHA